MPNLPQEFLNSLSEFDNFDTSAFINAHKEESKITSIRINSFKIKDLNFELNNKVDWCQNGFYLNDRPLFTLDPLFHAGCYYVQEAGSMFVEFALKQTVNFNQNIKVLDACASPGGKSTIIASLINSESLLVANEIIKSRSEVLSQNLSKWGACNNIVINNDPEKFTELNSFFDAILVDAPCSGSGLFRKQPDAINEWNVNNVSMCSIRQKKILTSIIGSLKENGILVYSTCSYSKEENEEIVQWLINEFNFEYIRLEVDSNWGIIETEFGYRFYPHLTKSEGFFCAVLQKKDGRSKINIKIKSESNITPSEMSIIKPFIDFSNNRILKKNNLFYLLNLEALKFVISYEKLFYFRKAGTTIGEIKGKDFVPNYEMALSNQIGKNIFHVDLNIEQAINFLKKVDFSYDLTTKGLALVSYKKMNLGWVKILSNRINNYYPNELRILK